MPVFFPAPPTDNLYKFMAISGCWMLGFVCVFMIYGVYLTYELEKSSDAVVGSIRHQQAVAEIDKRVAAISMGNCDDNIISWVSLKDCSETEKKFLLGIKQWHVEILDEYKEDSEERDIIVRYAELYFDRGLGWAVPIFLIVGCFLCGYGFRGWKICVQAPSDEKLRLENILLRQNVRDNYKEKLVTSKNRWVRFTRR